MNKISVVIPAYNVEKYIDKSFESLLNQTFKEFEVIAINDGSQDYTLEKMKAYEARDSR
ncbi:MAG: glycosyltransferase family 2 protein, partial [Turicibacter sp.]